MANKQTTSADRHLSNHVFCIIATAVVVQLLLPSAIAETPRLTQDLKVKFYSDVSMLCDHVDLNLTENAIVKAISWLFPDGSIVRGNEDLSDTRHFLFSPPGVSVAVTDESIFNAYNLTAQRVDDNIFGYYTCIIVYTAPLSEDGELVSAVRWGLNVNGADFSELEETYKQNAIVGGIAAAVMLVLVGGGCLLWHFNYNKRHGEDDLKKSGLQDLDNKLDADAEMTETSAGTQAGKVNDGFDLEMTDVILRSVAGSTGGARASGQNGMDMKF